MRMVCLVVASLVLVFGSGCGGNYLYDDIDIELDFELTNSDELHLPYVAGTEVIIGASDGSDGNEERAWTLTSSDPTVLRIDSQQDARADCTAVGAGTATISVVDEEGEVVHEADVSVQVPDQARVIPHGPMIIGREGPIIDVRILAGGTATYLVRYYRDGVRLYGNGVLSVTGGVGLVSARPETTFLFENREWLQLDAFAPGSGEITLEAAGLPVATVPLTVVSDAELATLELIDDERVAADEREEGSNLTVLALARDAVERPVYGLQVSWDLDGDGLPGLGDLFRYSYVPGVSHTLGAAAAGLRAEIPVRATGGQVDSSNDLGCAVSAPGTPGERSAGSIAAIAALMLVGLGRRRRRQRPPRVSLCWP